MGSVWLMKVCLIWVCVILLEAEGKEYSQGTEEWNVEYIQWSPDGVESVVMGINGQFPGPTIWARAGQTINIRVTNKLHTEGVVIHWHGIRQMKTPWMDGTASISQCPINPGESFLYSFVVDRAGTYFYHGHYGMQRSAGLYGMLIVDVAEGEKEKFEYDGELKPLLLSDWWHKASHEQEVYLSSNPMRWIGEPQTLLINGRGQFGCSLEASGKAEHPSPPLLGAPPPPPPSNLLPPCTVNDGDKHAPDILDVFHGKTYRLRIASSTALASLSFAIGGHKMRVVEADGNYVEPFDVDKLYIYSGESYSVLLKTDQPTYKYWISMSMIGRDPKSTPPGLAILNYGASASKYPIGPPPLAPKWDDYIEFKKFSDKIHALPGSPKPSEKHERRLVLLNTQNDMGGLTKWSINGITLALRSTPLLGAIKYDLADAFNQSSPPDSYDADNYDINSPPPPKLEITSGNGVYKLALDTTVDVILQNAKMTNGKEEIHPWHLHGHDFWVLAYGEGKFMDKDEAKFDLEKAPLRNTAVVFPGGWTALRFKADNPGVWAFHCHIEPHLHLGMGVVFAEAIQNLKEQSIPSDGLVCGLVAKKLINHESSP